MFVWTSSSNGRPGIGCCGGMLLLLPLCLFISSTGSSGDSLILLVVAVVVAVVFIFPRITQRRYVNVPNMVVMGDMTEKRKYGDIIDAEYTDSLDKPKRRLGDGYILTDDGEVIPREDTIDQHGKFDSGM